VTCRGVVPDVDPAGALETIAGQQTHLCATLQNDAGPTGTGRQRMIGEKLGRYTIIDKLGAGSMGPVYRAEDSSDGKSVAIKLVRSSILYDASKRERFLQGLLAASEIRHAGICPILEIRDEDDDFFVVTPFLQAETLEKMLHSRSLDWTESLDIAIAAGDALTAVHAAGAIHRAFKPANIWLQRDNVVILTDCCLARFTEIEGPHNLQAHEHRVECADTIIPMSALAYMSPEQIRGDPLDYRSDIFSFGVVLCEMLAGHHPFEARNSLSRMSAILEADPALPSARRGNLPRALDGIVARALAKERQGRYQRMDELAHALRLVRAGAKPVSDGPVPQPAKIRPSFLYPAMLIVGLIILVLTAVAIYKLAF